MADLNPAELLGILQASLGPTVGGRYVHWDKLRHLPLPEGVDLKGWWLGLKLQRQAGSQSVPLFDKGGSSFTFNLVDPLPECLHDVDSQTRGTIRQDAPVTNAETRDSYVTRSLIEESITSSQLEGASTQRVVAKRMIREGREPRDRSERMILNNYRAMQRIREIKDRELTGELVFEIHRMITEGTLDHPEGAGRFRRDDERIRVVDMDEVELHVPPPASELAERLSAMCDFANGRDKNRFIHPMIRSMILHFWLAYDHPFIDGNGRTARALFYWSMLRQGYWLFEFVTISKIMLNAPARYGQAFLYVETDENDLTYFLLYHAEVIRRAVDELQAYLDQKAIELRKAQENLTGLIELNSRQSELIRHALRHPGQIYTVESHRASHEVVYETARSDLMDLVERGLLLKKKSGKTWQFRAAPQLENRLRGSAD